MTLKQLQRSYVQQGLSATPTAITTRHCINAYLADLAIANGWRMVSFDRDFARFEGLERWRW
ncbi:hypothetical protein [Synechococcus sp. UW140]|uniref:hypothetical protein n=1 Tax=Synechococcus sp. UW140 TaxID=368503 RepID=UPI003137EAAD